MFEYYPYNKHDIPQNGEKKLLQGIKCLSLKLTPTMAHLKFKYVMH